MAQDASNKAFGHSTAGKRGGSWRTAAAFCLAWLCAAGSCKGPVEEGLPFDAQPTTAPLRQTAPAPASKRRSAKNGVGTAPRPPKKVQSAVDGRKNSRPSNGIRGVPRKFQTSYPSTRTEPPPPTFAFKEELTYVSAGETKTFALQAKGDPTGYVVKRLCKKWAKLTSQESSEGKKRLRNAPLVELEQSARADAFPRSFAVQFPEILRAGRYVLSVVVGKSPRATRSHPNQIVACAIVVQQKPEPDPDPTEPPQPEDNLLRCKVGEATTLHWGLDDAKRYTLASDVQMIRWGCKRSSPKKQFNLEAYTQGTPFDNSTTFLPKRPGTYDLILKLKRDGEAVTTVQRGISVAAEPTGDAC